eukprot:TRINITY_DN673_c0_g2_i15.p1 TRINITY_DN673_c0_g2~~TRINITY_DN673_c0_g2_i15.p1  ORF type:complete len:237 (-),score=-14.82 TRINITY_DN673_c0_g2_i15:1401-2111(-)
MVNQKTQWYRLLIIQINAYWLFLIEQNKKNSIKVHITPFIFFILCKRNISLIVILFFNQQIQYFYTKLKKWIEHDTQFGVQSNIILYQHAFTQKFIQNQKEKILFSIAQIFSLKNSLQIDPSYKHVSSTQKIYSSFIYMHAYIYIHAFLIRINIHFFFLIQQQQYILPFQYSILSKNFKAICKKLKRCYSRQCKKQLQNTKYKIINKVYSLNNSLTFTKLHFIEIYIKIILFMFLN